MHMTVCGVIDLIIDPRISPDYPDSPLLSQGTTAYRSPSHSGEGLFKG